MERTALLVLPFLLWPFKDFAPRPRSEAGGRCLGTAPEQAMSLEPPTDTASDRAAAERPLTSEVRGSCEGLASL